MKQTELAAKKELKMGEDEDDLINLVSGASDELDAGAEGAARADKLDKPFKIELVWFNITAFIILHSFVPIAIYLGVRDFPWRTMLYSLVVSYLGGLGVTAGSHRLWSHRSYKAKLPVQLLLMAMQTMAGQNSIYTWSRDHRVHHKFAETDADPHNIKRGFFFAHMGWLCCRKHPEVKRRGKLIDMSDLEANWVVTFQHRHFWWLALLFAIVIPCTIPVIGWGERPFTAFVFAFAIRYLLSLHGTWLVNSAAHYIGTKPYDKHIEAVESPYVIYTAIGEGFHNYHHTFPYDYAAGEFGQQLNVTTAMIDAFATLGLVSDRRRANRKMVQSRAERTGDPECQPERKAKLAQMSACI